MQLEQGPKTYILLKDLGSGSYSTVKHALDQNGNHVAVKKYNPNKSNVKDMINQVKILKSLDHPNIVKVLDWKQSAILTHRNGSTQSCWALIMEYFEGGQLFDILKYTGPFSQRVTRSYFIQIMNALKYMHNKGYTHRDLKPQNIMLSEDYILKIVDFGFSCQRAGPNNTGRLKRDLGTQGYKAPQIQEKRNYDGQKVDIFAAGVILLNMYSGKRPFEKTNKDDDFYKEIMQQNYHKFWKPYDKVYNQLYGDGYFSLEFKNLFNRMVAYKQNERITMKQIQNHPWVLGPTMTHEQINSELQQKKQKAEFERLKKINDQNKMEEQINHLGLNQRTYSNIRSNNELLDNLFGLIVDESKISRPIKKFEQILNRDIVLCTQDKNYVIARLKKLFNDIEINPYASAFQTINYDKISKDLLIRCKQIQDNNTDEIQAQFHCMQEVPGEDQNDVNVTLTVIIGKDNQENLVLRLQRKDGDEQSFRRILYEVQNTFAFKIQKKQNKIQEKS